jgi:hypothetical protein
LFVCIGQYNDDSRATQRIQQQQQQNGIESDDEDDDRSTMFQADYEYTPLKEYAAMRNNRTTNDNNTNSYPSKCFTFFFYTKKKTKFSNRLKILFRRFD